MEDVDRRAIYERVCECCGKTFSSYGNRNRKFGDWQNFKE